MIKLTSRMVEYFQKHQQLFENNDFEAFFEEIEENLKKASLKGYGLPHYYADVLYDSKVNFLNYMDEIPYELFSKTELEEIVIPANIKKIGNYAFSDSDRLKKVIFEKAPKNIEFDEVESVFSLSTPTIELPSGKSFKLSPYAPERRFFDILE